MNRSEGDTAPCQEGEGAAVLENIQKKRDMIISTHFDGKPLIQVVRIQIDIHAVSHDDAAAGGADDDAAAADAHRTVFRCSSSAAAAETLTNPLTHSLTHKRRTLPARHSIRSRQFRGASVPQKSGPVFVRQRDANSHTLG